MVSPGRRGSGPNPDHLGGSLLQLDQLGQRQQHAVCRATLHIPRVPPAVCFFQQNILRPQMRICIAAASSTPYQFRAGLLEFACVGEQEKERGEDGSMIGAEGP